MEPSDALLERGAKAVVDRFCDVAVRIPGLWRVLDLAVVQSVAIFPRARWLRALCVHWGEAVVRARPLTWRVARLGPCGRLLVQLVPGQAHFYYGGLHERETTSLLERFLRPGDTFVDAGAHVGYFAIRAACRGATVHAFEPVPSLTAQFRESVRLSGVTDRVYVNQQALGQQTASSAIYQSPDPGESGRASLLPLAGLALAPSAVEVVAFDEYAAAHRLGKLRAIKIDVEGGEKAVLEGAAGALRSESRPDLVICEVSGPDRGCDPEDVLKLMAGAGYRPYRITSAGLTPFEPAHADVRWGQENLAFLREGVHVGSRARRE